MKRVLYFVLFVVMLTGCGSNGPTGRSGNPAQPTTMQPGWTTALFQNWVGLCAASGEKLPNQKYSNAAWTSYCSCFYGSAATQWTPSAFATNYPTNYQSLLAAGTVRSCIVSAAMNPQDFTLQQNAPQL